MSGGQLRNSRYRKCLAILICFLSLTLISPLSADTATDEENARKLEQLQKGIANLRGTLDSIRSKRTKVQNELRRMEKAINRINRKLRQLKQDIASQKVKLDKLFDERAVLRKELKRQRHLLASQVRASYIMGRQEQLKIILNQGDPSTLKRALVYYDYLNRSRTEQIKTALLQLQRLEQVEEQIISEKQTLEKLVDEQRSKRTELVSTRKERKKFLLALTRELRSKDKQLERMLQNEKELQQVLQAVAEALSDIPADGPAEKTFSEQRGQLPWPVAGKVKARFGSQRAAGGLRWSGMLIDASSGRDVRAIARGRVAFADWLRGYGMMVILDHGDGYMSLYGHNQSLFKEIGEWVEAGEVIAAVGSSGGQEESQLYFELRAQGKPVNPMKWCRRTQGNVISLR